MSGVIVNNIMFVHIHIITEPELELQLEANYNFLVFCSLNL
jgi:hypothetical protein